MTSSELTSYSVVKTFSSKIRKKQGYPLSPLLFNIVLEVLPGQLGKKKTIGKEEIKLSLLADDMITLYRKP